jgi:2-polyprenyl-6-methoxyphenol hydroxylase-like FAD-dependent oxidoreductase
MRGMVIGGGIGGLAAALAMKRIGIDARVFEQAPQIQEVGAGLSLWSNAVSALDRLGVADQVIRHGSVYRRGRTITADGRLLSEVDLHAINPHVPCVMARRTDLQQELLSALGAEHVTVDAKCTSVSQASQQVEAQFANGRAEQADFLIGADGIHSVVREQLFGTEAPRYSGFTGWRALAEFELRELEQDTTILIMGVGFQMGIFHCGPGRVYWFLAHAAKAGGRDDAEGPRAYLLKRFEGCTSLLTSTLSATCDQRIMRNDLFDRPSTWPWGQGRITLLGDAIHPTTPNLGQGACQAIEDAVFLADSILRHPTIEPALRHYEHRRRQRTAMVSRQSRQFGRLLGLKNPLLARLRNRLMASSTGKRQGVKLMTELLTYELPELRVATP